MPVPAWLTIVSWIFIGGLLSAALITADIYLLGYREHIKIMEAVWPLTAPVRRPTRPRRLLPLGTADVVPVDEGPRPRHAWQAVLGILFQYFVITPMRHLAFGKGSGSPPRPTSWR